MKRTYLPAGLVVVAGVLGLAGPVSAGTVGAATVPGVEGSPILHLAQQRAQQEERQERREKLREQRQERREQRQERRQERRQDRVEQRQERRQERIEQRRERAQELREQRNRADRVQRQREAEPQRRQEAAEQRRQQAEQQRRQQAEEQRRQAAQRAQEEQRERARRQRDAQRDDNDRRREGVVREGDRRERGERRDRDDRRDRVRDRREERVDQDWLRAQRARREERRRARRERRRDERRAERWERRQERITEEREASQRIRRRELVGPRGERRTLRSRRYWVRNDRYRNRFRRGRSIYYLPPVGAAIALGAYVVSAQNADYDTYVDTFMAPPVVDLDRRYTLEEVVQNPELRSATRSVNLNTVLFATGSSELSDAQYEKLEGVADAMLAVLDKRPNDVFLIEGHTDAVGSFESNLELSELRAASVQQALVVEFGVPADHLESVGYGEQYLLVETEESEAANRRVMIRSIGPLLKRN